MEEWVREAQKGNDQAFYELISQYRDKLYKTAWYYLRDEQAALEAIQEVTCRAYLKIGKLREPKYFSTWLVRIVVNYCMDELKRSRRNVPLEEWDAVEPAGGEDIDTKIELASCVEKLRPHYRDVIVLKYFEDMTVEDIASAMNKPEGTVKTWIARALGQLRKSMKGSDYYVS
jgi:RNA polymerase sigma-70 factor, ECF subfamily